MVNYGLKNNAQKIRSVRTPTDREIEHRPCWCFHQQDNRIGHY